MKLDILWEDLEPFLKYRRNLSTSTIRGYKNRYDMFLRWFGDKEFNANNFDKLLSEYEKLGRSASWRNNCLKLVKHIAAYLKIKEEFEEYSYLDDHSGQPENVLTPEQIKQLAEAKIKYLRFKNRKEKHRALIYFLGNIGSRIDETLKLEWSDIQPDEKTSIIHFRKEITKTKKERFCPTPKWLLTMVLALPHEDKYVFSKIAAANFRRDLELRRKLCKIPFHVTPHTFRDSSINNKLEVDIPLQEVTALHGHATTNTTYKYYVKIQAKNLAKNLKKHDPAYYQDQTYDTFIETKKEDIENSLNNRVCNFIHKEEVNEEKKRIVWFGFIEK